MNSVCLPSSPTKECYSCSFWQRRKLSTEQGSSTRTWVQVQLLLGCNGASWNFSISSSMIWEWGAPSHRGVRIFKRLCEANRRLPSVLSGEESFGGGRWEFGLGQRCWLGRHEPIAYESICTTVIHTHIWWWIALVPLLSFRSSWLVCSTGQSYLATCWMDALGLCGCESQGQGS